MLVATRIKAVKEIVKKAKADKKSIGFVPTMGALHLGHLSLVRQAKRDTDFVVVSIFVNPIQFSPKEDYRSYPRTFIQDKALLQKEGVDLIFYPSSRLMYPKGFSTYVEEVRLSKYLCGRVRPGHFRGVCTVVTKLFNIVQPDISYFGQKDYQQALIIKRMVDDLNFPLKIKVLPTIREKNGLAMSSRNKYLTPQEYEKASCLYRALKLGKAIIDRGEREAKVIIKQMKEFIYKNLPLAKIDYISIVNANSLEDVQIIEDKVLLALAVYVGRARLIDNMVVRVRGGK
ncbi:MAG: pantoate--beta-alanine ligase [Candidatus Omnitrophica bacterium]|nr:pantoate--beta-alanine ligase [Candidatus Omnitrophota bacterium]MCM8825986.1 pantoate--beta-alanine ligase [Candidatus Omnitrophota bacterium]